MSMQIIEYLVVILVTTLLPGCLTAQKKNTKNIVNQNAIFDNQIKTVLFHREGEDFSFPAIALNNSEILVLRFDLLADLEEDYSYSIELCNADWNPSDLSSFEYLEGYTENPLPQAKQSINTTVAYRHSELEIPNQDMKWTQSGNYILKVYYEDNPEKLLLTERFLVYEEKAEIEFFIDRSESNLLESKQSLKLKAKSYLFKNLLPDRIKVAVIQNYDWNTLKYYDNFYFDGNGDLLLNMSEQITFDAGNEFRFFDMKSLKFISERVDKMNFNAGSNHVYLKPDQLRIYKGHFSNEDLNGLYYIKNQEGYDQRHLDSDYAWVHFNLLVDNPFLGDVYIYGALSNWSYNSQYIMTYNPDLYCYEAKILLKQGYYNYRYVVIDESENIIDISITEDNYAETENTYIAIIYYFSEETYSWEIIGYNVLNAVNAQPKEE